MMLKPTMSELLDIIPNRYLLVNVAAKRARDIADASEQAGEPLDEKPVKLALWRFLCSTSIRPIHSVRDTFSPLRRSRYNSSSNIVPPPFRAVTDCTVFCGKRQESFLSLGSQFKYRNHE